MHYSIIANFRRFEGLAFPCQSPVEIWAKDFSEALALVFMMEYPCEMLSQTTSNVAPIEFDLN